jgi:hypothetical protein
MPVFLSHKREDTEHAQAIGAYLTRRSVKCYIDIADPSIQATDDLTALLMQRVKACTHLMAVVSGYTTQSWWVPFEIGVASELERRITAYRVSYVSLPDFLSKWPILSTQQDLDTFIQYYRTDSLVPNVERLFKTPTISTASGFHLAVKAALRQ